MKAIEINRHFLDLAGWVDPQTTVDRVIIGDPDKEAGRVLVTWIASFQALRAAAERGADLLMTHEPTFYVHANELEQMDDSDVARAKRQFIEERGLVVLRNHDVWDRMPEVGIPWAWARFLGLEGPPAATAAGGCQQRYDVEPLALDDFAAEVAGRTAALGEEAVQVVGEGQSTVSRVGIGTGCFCDIRVFQQMGCDVSVVCDDGSSGWRTIQRAADEGHPVVRVNHGTSEEPGMATLTEYINQHLAGVEAEHLPHGATFRLVSATVGL
ncbi:MAG: Nif3-like dinuclear metal center hexameric protein [Candidatus Brocadiia bacterium]